MRPNSQILGSILTLLLIVGCDGSHQLENKSGSAPSSLPRQAPPSDVGESLAYPALENVQQVFFTVRSRLVAAELKLTRAQLDALPVLDDSYQTLLNRHLFSPEDRLSQSEFKKQEADFREQVMRLFQPDQIRRLHEIMCQRFGLELFEIRGITDQLNLTADQFAQINRVSGDHRKTLQRDFDQLGGDDLLGELTPEKKKSFHELHVRTQQSTDRSLKAILDGFDDAQKASYKSLVGRPIDIVAITEQISWGE